VEHKQAIALNLQHTVEQIAAASLLRIGQSCLQPQSLQLGAKFSLA
jgi:hypothetical protein